MVILKVHSKNSQKNLSVNAPCNLLDALTDGGYFIPANCGGKGSCKKCRVRVISGSFENAAPDKDGYILSCKAVITASAEIEVPEVSGRGITAFAGSADAGGQGKQYDFSGYGIALDIGTTTLAAALTELDTGREIGVYSCLNPQAAYGADVLSRISAAGEGKLKTLQKLIADKANDIAGHFMTEHSVDKITEMTVCGNTVMLHLFCGEDPVSIGKYPFTPAFTELREYEGSALGISAEKIIVLPSVSGYIGSDITAGILALNMARESNTALLVDIGTNAEMALFSGGRLTCCSAAAGPAFEGADIECGTGGIPGAISRISMSGGRLNFSTVEGEPPIGICGSGLIDAISIMLKSGIIDQNGDFCDSCESGSLKNVKDGKFYIHGNIYISQKDVRQFQLAKSAIYTGIITLVKSAGMRLADIDKLYIAGGLGFYVDKANAVKTGIIPAALKQKIRIAGNSGLYGAKLCLSRENQEEITRIAKSCDTLELSDDEAFYDGFIENMTFKGIW